jgi:hypothetical protein
MGIWSIFQNRRLMRCGDGEGYASRVLDVPVKRVGGLFREIRRAVNAKARDQEALLLLKSRIPCFQEKPLSFSQTRPYRKPTQVGRMKILRRLRELRRRNSAN